MKYRNQERMKILNEKSKTKPLKVLEHEKREEGLNKTISPENKGFALLQRMGYKPGMALGKKSKSYFSDLNESTHMDHETLFLVYSVTYIYSFN